MTSGIEGMFSRKDYSVKVRGRSGILYSEGGNTVVIDSEMLAAGPFDMVVYRDSLTTWITPGGEQSLSDEDRARIRRNVEDGLANLKLDWQ